MNLSGRVYVTRDKGSRVIRRYKVVLSEYVPHPTGRGVKIIYTTLSRHFTAQAAYKAAKAANRERGNGIH